MTISTTKGTDIMNALLISQYANSENLKEYMSAFIEEMDLLFYEVENVYLGRFLDNAVGAQLDVIGRILNEPRDVAVESLYFGFSDDGTAPAGVAGFADENDPANGGIFFSEDQGSQDNPPLSDVQYKRLLKAKAYLLSNKTLNADTVYNAVSILLGKTVRGMKIIDEGEEDYYINSGSLTDINFLDNSQRDNTFGSNVDAAGGTINMALVNQLDNSTSGKVGLAFNTSVEVGQTYDLSWDYDNTNAEPSDYVRVLINETSSGNTLYDSGNLNLNNTGTITSSFTSTESNITYYLFVAGVGNASNTPGAYVSYDNIIFSYSNSGSVELELSALDVTQSDQAFIQYFSKYFIPMATNFFITRV